VRLVVAEAVSEESAARQPASTSVQPAVTAAVAVYSDAVAAAAAEVAVQLDNTRPHSPVVGLGAESAVALYANDTLVRLAFHYSFH
jgi:hypothetical protein